MAEHIDVAYKKIEEAIASGKLVELCSIDQNGCVASWSPLGDRSARTWHPSRYRIEGEEVWPHYVNEIGRVAEKEE